MSIGFRFAAAIAAVLLASGVPASVRAANYALLIGASQYPNPADRLNGPPNDVALMYRVLRERGFAATDIRVLLDAPPGTAPEITPDGPPTRAAILADFDRLVQRVRPGDFVLIQFSGHGSQQPEPEKAGAGRSEPDGLDEVFLPADIGTWSNEKSTVENAIVDDEIGERVRAVRARGAFVWIIVDSCHSGTMTRGVDDDVRDKRVTPESLGIPPDRLTAARSVARARTRSTSADTVPPAPSEVIAGPTDATRDGGFVAFFAAQPQELAIETFLPRAYDAPDRKPRSLLSYYVAQALTSNPGATYRQVAQQVLAGYDRFGAKAPTPMFEGDLDRPVLGSGAGGQARPILPVRKRPDGRWEIEAGRLHGLSEGSLVALWPADAQGGQSAQPLARARATQVEMARSLLELDGAAAAALPARLTGTVEERAVALTLTVARPYPAGDADTARAQAAVDALMPKPAGQGGGGAALVGGTDLALGVVPPDAPADVYLRVADGRLWLLPATGEWRKEGRGRTPSLPIPPSADKLAADLQETLRRQAVGLNLVRMAPDFAQGALAESLHVETLVLRDQTPADAVARATPADARPCLAVPRTSVPPPATPVALEQTPELHHCDTVYVRLTNRGARPIDVTLLFLDADGQIDAVPETTGGLRLEPGAPPEVVALRIATWNRAANAPSTTGIERLLVIGVERGVGDDLSYVVGFDHLAANQAATRSMRPAASAGGALRSLLETATFAPGRTRSVGVAAGGALQQQATMRIVRWNTRPPEER